MKKIDCLLIGHNEMNFSNYEEYIRIMGMDTGAYKDLSMNFVHFQGKKYTINDVFNEYSQLSSKNNLVNLGETLGGAITYIGTYLNKKNIKFDYINSFQYEQEKLLKILQEQEILTVAITTTLYVSVLPILEIVQFIRKYNENVKIIIGGPFIGTSIRVLEQDALDYLFKSIGADYYINNTQGEGALANIINTLKLNMPLSEVKNIYYKKDDKYVYTQSEPEEHDLDEYMVNWDLFLQDKREHVVMRTAVSCPFSCAFCGFPEHSGKYRVANVDSIETALKQLHEKGKVKYIHFIDDTFNIPKDRFKDILKMMIKNNFKFKWHSYFRAQFADEETIVLMKESGCEGVFLGIESGSNMILKNMNKQSTVEQYLYGIELLRKHGIVTYGNFIIGFPGETKETVEETIKFIENSGLDFYRVQLWYCEPITPIWRQRERYKIEGQGFQWKHATMSNEEASDIIKSIFNSNLNSVWVPQYNFDFAGLWHFVHRGMTIEEVKYLLESFNDGVKERLISAQDIENSHKTMNKIISACRLQKNIQEDNINIDAIEAEFDF